MLIASRIASSTENGMQQTFHFNCTQTLSSILKKGTNIPPFKEEYTVEGPIQKSDLLYLFSFYQFCIRLG